MGKALKTKKPVKGVKLFLLWYRKEGDWRPGHYVFRTDAEAESAGRRIFRSNEEWCVRSAILPE